MEAVPEDTNSKRVYVDGTDWEWEVGQASDGNMIYPSAKDIEKYNTCSIQCGVARCRITLLDWVREPDLGEFEGLSSEDIENKTEKYFACLAEDLKVVLSSAKSSSY